MKKLTALIVILASLLPLSSTWAALLDNGDGTVTDTTTGLVWMRCSMGQTWSNGTCNGVANSYSLEEAKMLAPNFAGQNDWRLPNIRELQTIVDRSYLADRYYFPAAIDPVAFPNTTYSSFLSSSALPNNPAYTWTVDFGLGIMNLYSATVSGNQVRLVRAGQSPALLSDARPDSDYTQNGDGTVTHVPSGLTWKQCREGQIWSGSTCSGKASTYTWDQARAITTNFAGRSDWRLPTEDELISLIDYTKQSHPAINTNVFPNAPSFAGDGFWSASAGREVSDAWAVNCYLGDVQMNLTYAKYNALLVRADVSINLIEGWNLIGNSASSPIKVATTFVDGTNIASIWKWVTNGSTSGITYPAWAFYTPTQTDGGQAYAISKGYDFLTNINKGEGFWVNAKQPQTVQIPTGNAILGTDFQPSGDLALKSGWNLISVGRITSPQDFNAAQGSDVTTIWAWNSMQKNWYFYSPSLEAVGGPASLGVYLTSYITTKGYLDFSKDNRRFEPGVGFWVNRP